MRLERTSFLAKITEKMFEKLRRRDDTCLERRSDDDALRSTSSADRDVTTATQVYPRANTSGQMLLQRNEFTVLIY